jgi:hypothetical protein
MIVLGIALRQTAVDRLREQHLLQRLDSSHDFG